MFSAETDLWAVVANQYRYKLKSHLGSALTLMLGQLIVLLVGTVGGSGSGQGNLSVWVGYDSPDVAFFYTCIWLLVLAVSLANPLEEQRAFALVANRTSNDLANLGVLLTAWLYGGVALTLFAGLQRWYLYFSSGAGEVRAEGFYLTWGGLGLSLAAFLLYLLLIAAAGYLFGVLLRIGRWLAVFLVVLLPSVLGGGFLTPYGLTHQMADFFLAEHSLSVFALKVLGVSLVLFGCGAVLSQRLEVKR